MIEDAAPRAALWLRSAGAPPAVESAPVREPGDDEVVVRVRIVAVNPVDGLRPVARRIVLPWLRYPMILGSDVAGEVAAVGSSVTRFQVGDRVLGHAAGSERSRNRPEEGAFQTHAVLLARVTAAIPDSMTFPAAAVLPLALSTAAAGLFEPDQLALGLPTADPPTRDETVLVWGGSTSVGMNAIQLARNSGYRVVATASPRNFRMLERLGAEAVFDRSAGSVADAVTQHLQTGRLAGVVAIGAGSLPQAIRITRATRGTKRIASAYPTPPTRVRALLERRRGITISAIWGGTPIDTAVGPAIYREFLPDALADGRYVPAPDPLLHGEGLAAIPSALTRLRAGVSARKIVVPLVGA